MFETGLGQSRSYSWTHFLQAMVDAGFSVTHRGGSAVSFKSDRGVIVFHRSHPEPNIDPVMLSSMGKWLRKWFGWGRDSFVARTKQKA
jgi:predicted RNA binding protein YcfA (HicA-like mRNA interferase family)